MKSVVERLGADDIIIIVAYVSSFNLHFGRGGAHNKTFMRCSPKERYQTL